MKVSYKYHTFNLPLRWLRCLKRRMRWVRAAGCVVQTLLQAALREAEEETGITPLPTTHYPLPTKTYHTFNLYGGWHLKQTSWFDAHVAGEKPVGKPQDEEGITEVVWVTPDEWYRRLQHSYGTLRTLSAQVNKTP